MDGVSGSDDTDVDAFILRTLAGSDQRPERATRGWGLGSLSNVSIIRHRYVSELEALNTFITVEGSRSGISVWRRCGLDRITRPFFEREEAHSRGRG
jgi:hypothetical protein